MLIAFITTYLLAGICTYAYMKKSLHPSERMAFFFLNLVFWWVFGLYALLTE